MNLENPHTITVPFNNMWTLKFKAQPEMRFPLQSIKCSAASPSFRLLPSTVRCLNRAQLFDYRALGSSRKLGGAAEYLIDGCETHLSVEI